MTSSAAGKPASEGQVQRCRVRVWFGNHVIADYFAEADLAKRYVAAISRRFEGLRITSEPISGPEVASERPLPAEQLWQLTPH